MQGGNGHCGARCCSQDRTAPISRQSEPSATDLKTHLHRLRRHHAHPATPMCPTPNRRVKPAVTPDTKRGLPVRPLRVDHVVGISEVNLALCCESARASGANRRAAVVEWRNDSILKRKCGTFATLVILGAVVTTTWGTPRSLRPPDGLSAPPGREHSSR
jgi:hypothetical protein